MRLKASPALKGLIQYDKNVWIKVYWHAGLVITVKFETAWRLI